MCVRKVGGALSSHTVALIGLRIVAQSARTVVRTRGRQLLLIADDVQTFEAADRVLADLRKHVACRIARFAFVDVLALAAADVQEVARRTVPAVVVPEWWKLYQSWHGMGGAANQTHS